MNFGLISKLINWQKSLRIFILAVTLFLILGGIVSAENNQTLQNKTTWNLPKKCGVNTFVINNYCGVGSFKNAYVQCYDGYETTLGDATSCKSSETWQQYAKEVCVNRCSTGKEPNIIPKPLPRFDEDGLSPCKDCVRPIEEIFAPNLPDNKTFLPGDKDVLSHCKEGVWGFVYCTRPGSPDDIKPTEPPIPYPMPRWKPMPRLDGDGLYHCKVGVLGAYCVRPIEEIFAPKLPDNKTLPSEPTSPNDGTSLRGEII